MSAEISDDEQMMIITNLFLAISGVYSSVRSYLEVSAYHYFNVFLKM